MTPGRIVAIVAGGLLGLLGFTVLAGGAALSIGYAVAADDDGYFDVTLDRLASPTAAITTGEVDLRADPGPPGWFLDFVDATVRIEVTGIGERSAEVFVGIGPEADVARYLSGVSQDRIDDVDADHDVRYETTPGAAQADPPAGQAFWVATASGRGSQELVWDVADGSWTAVLMNADGSSGITAQATVGVRSGALPGLGIALLVTGALAAAAAVAVIVLAARGRGAEVVPGEVALPRRPGPEPLRLEAAIDDRLSPWQWLVKWFLAIPHFVVLAILWAAFVVLTLIAGVAILFTGRYPRGIFDFNVGVLRWTWRVACYAASGGLNTDRYPPFTLAPVPGYPADLDVAYPEELSRGLVLVKWWLLAIPHYLILAAIGGVWWDVPAGLLGILVLIAAVILLFTGRYPQSLFDLIVGLNRWGFRVVTYAALMTDRYPPFRLDQGGGEPGPAPLAADGSGGGAG